MNNLLTSMHQKTHIYREVPRKWQGPIVWYRISSDSKGMVSLCIFRLSLTLISSQVELCLLIYLYNRHQGRGNCKKVSLPKHWQDHQLFGIKGSVYIVFNASRLLWFVRKEGTVSFRYQSPIKISWSQPRIKFPHQNISLRVSNSQ